MTHVYISKIKYWLWNYKKIINESLNRAKIGQFSVLISTTGGAIEDTWFFSGTNTRLSAICLQGRCANCYATEPLNKTASICDRQNTTWKYFKGCHVYTCISCTVIMEIIFIVLNNYSAVFFCRSSIRPEKGTHPLLWEPLLQAVFNSSNKWNSINL